MCAFCKHSGSIEGGREGYVSMGRLACSAAMVQKLPPPHTMMSARPSRM